MTRNKLVHSLKRIKYKLCSYMSQDGKICDCKFIDNEPDDKICCHSENGSGCPEIMLAYEIINALTPTEFNRIIKRAKLGFNLEQIKKGS